MLFVLALGVLGTLLANAFPSRWATYKREQPIVERVHELRGSAFSKDWSVIEVHLAGSNVRDDDMKLMAELNELATLDLSFTRISYDETISAARASRGCGKKCRVLR